MRLKLIYLGQIYCRKHLLVDTKDKEEMIVSPITSLLIDHPKLGRILYDTGCDGDWDKTGPEALISAYPIERSETIVRGLEEEGLAPEDIDLLILSHLHFDHAGGLKYFANTKAGKNVIVSTPDAKEAFFRVNLNCGGVSGEYVKKLFSDIPGVGFRPVSGEVQLAPDIRLFSQRCHTPGVLGLQLNMKSGPIVVTGDTVHTRENWEKRLPPGGAANRARDEFYRNLEALRQRKEISGAELLFGHDYAQAGDWARRGWIK